MAIELVLDASVSLAWFLKETPECAAYAATVSAAASARACAVLREHRRKVLKRAKLKQAFEELDSFDIRVHLELFGRGASWISRVGTTCRATMPCTSIWRDLRQAARAHNVTLFAV